MAFRLISKRPHLVLAGGQHSILSFGQFQECHYRPLFCNSKTIISGTHSISSLATDQQTQANSIPLARRKDPLDLTFSNPRDAYKSKRTSELIRGYVVLTLSSFDFLVENQERVGQRFQTKFVLCDLTSYSFSFLVDETWSTTAGKTIVYLDYSQHFLCSFRCRQK